MTIKLGENNYGKKAINLSKIIRNDGFHEIRQISVGIAMKGDFDKVHYNGDNTIVLPTDTMKNTVYALAKEKFTESIEAFGLVLANHFISHNPQITEVQVEITEYNWSRLVVNGEAHPHSFVNGGSEKHSAIVKQSGTQTSVEPGIRNLMILKTTDSAFKEYLRDQYTTLKEAEDRIMATECEASWTFSRNPEDYTSSYKAVRNCLVSAFAFHKSLSVQHTLFAMGEAVLKDFAEIAQVSLKMPNKHHILYNLDQFGMSNDNEIFIATDEPYGYITGSVLRD